MSHLETQHPGELQLFQSRILLQTQPGPSFIDLTEMVQGQVEACKMQHGYVLVFSRHTTAGVVIQENEPLLLQDLRQRLDRLAPPEESYQHDNFAIRTENLGDDRDANGHSHCQALLTCNSVRLPVEQGKLGLGRWQRIFFLELDRSRSREVLLHLFAIS